MRHGSLFSGIGGFDLASEWMGWENVFHCEWNTLGQKVLNYYWPKTISYHDITKTDFSIHRGQIDIITGGFPCQPYSTAGKRKGKEDSRHLWPEMLRCIREVQPTWIVGENVLGLVNWNEGMVFEEVQTDLEAQGYTVQPYVLPAASVNAPHRRDRVWFVAYNYKFGCERYAEQIRDRRDSQEQIGGIDICEKQGWDEIRCLNEGSSKNRRTPTDSDNKRRSPGSGEIQSKDGEVSQWDNHAKPSDSDFRSDASDSKFKGLQGCTDYREVRSKKGEMGREGNKLAIESPSIFNKSNASDSNGFGLRSQGDRIRESRFFDKEGKIGNWDNFPTSSPICSRNDGLSDRLDGITFSKWRAESIKAGGNAIVPQVVYQIFKAIQQYNDLENEKDY
jgi:DNA (cytosine-5)-methyltransferase 1